MSKALSTLKLIESVKRRAMIPTSQATFSEQDFIDILNEELNTGLLPYLISQHEEHLVTYIDVPLSEGRQLADGFRRFEIPYRASGNKLRDVAYINNSGNIFEMSRSSLEDMTEFQNIRNYKVFYVEGNEIVLPQKFQDESGVIRMYFFLRPNTLVRDDKVGKIVDINTSTGVITLSNFPDDFSNKPEMDFIMDKSPNKILKYDVQPTNSNVSVKTVTFSPSDLPTQLRIGDYIAKKEESSIPQLPVELHPILAQRAAVHCLEALGDTEGLGNAAAKLQSMEKSVMNIIDDRVDGAPQKVRNRHSTLRQTGINLRRRF